MQHEKILILLKSVFFNKGKQACLKTKQKPEQALKCNIMLFLRSEHNTRILFGAVHVWKSISLAS